MNRCTALLLLSLTPLIQAGCCGDKTLCTPANTELHMFPTDAAENTSYAEVTVTREGASDRSWDLIVQYLRDTLGNNPDVLTGSCISYRLERYNTETPEWKALLAELEIKLEEFKDMVDRDTRCKGALLSCIVDYSSAQ